MSYSKQPVISKSVADLTFLTGVWRGQNAEDFFEEHWTQEIEGNMTGMFRWIKSGDIFVYEIMALIKRGKHILILLRHFNKEFVGWEDKEKPLTFLLTELDDSKAVFINPDKPDSGWLSYVLVDDNTLRFVDYKSDGTVGFELSFQKL
ncbi:MAG: DUF6265 family protein [Candidatus Thorarchaeota archaeon]